MVDHAVDSVMRKLRGTGDRDGPSRQVGEWVMGELRDFDHAAYVRFASIYRAFEDVNAFREAIERLQAQPSAEERKAQLPLLEAERSEARRAGHEWVSTSRTRASR